MIQHPYFQRLRRISQLGLTNLVYSGANHSRFEHALGAMHLMQQAIDVIKSKGHEVTEDEYTAVCIAILLHDIGHGPYSHTLEQSLVRDIHHEVVSGLIMDKINNDFDGELSLAISIFRGQYHKQFLHQLVSSQLDMDRLDYLKRDTFFSGVSEGAVSAQRLIKMLNVANDELVIDAKGIYPVEKFIIARRLMYWQVYLHKTVMSAEFMLIKILKRAKELAGQKIELFATPPLRLFLYENPTKEQFTSQPELLEAFVKLDDFDIMTAVKVWCNHDDKVLSLLCQRMVNRKLLKVTMQTEPIPEEMFEDCLQKTMESYGLTREEANYFVFRDEITNNAYDPKRDKINILYKNGEVKDIAEAADLLNISVLSQAVKKHFICYPEDQ